MELPGHYVDCVLELSKNDALTAIRIDFLVRKLAKYGEGTPEATAIVDQIESLASQLAAQANPATPITGDNMEPRPAEDSPASGEDEDMAEGAASDSGSDDVSSNQSAYGSFLSTGEGLAASEAALIEAIEARELKQEARQVAREEEEESGFDEISIEQAEGSAFEQPISQLIHHISHIANNFSSITGINIPTSAQDDNQNG